MGRPVKVCKVEGNGRARAQVLPGSVRVMSFAEAEPTYTLEEAVAEAQRCAASSRRSARDIVLTRQPGFDSLTRPIAAGNSAIERR